MNPGELAVTIDSGLLTNNLYKPDIQKYVYDYRGGFNDLNYMASQMGGYRKADARFGEVQDPLQELPVTKAQIASVTAISSTQLQLNWSDPNYSFFRLWGDVTNNFGLNTRAQTVVTQPGYIIIQSLDNAQVLNSADWAVNTYVVEEWNDHPYTSTGMQFYPEMPSLTYNYCGKMRETVTINEDDGSMTWVEGDDGNKYWASQQVDLKFEQMARQSELRSLKGVRALNTNQYKPGQATNGGLTWAIQDQLRGGVYTPYYSTLSLPILTQWLTDVANRYNSKISNITVLTGRGALMQFQTFTQNFIQYSGVFNTFGGAGVQGIDVYAYAIGGINVQFVHMSSLNSQDLFPNNSTVPGVNGSVEYNTMIAVDVQMMNTVASSTKLSPMQRIYKGPSEFTCKIQRGVTDLNVGFANSDDASSDVDAHTVQLKTNSGINCMAYNFGLLQPGM